MRHVLRRPLRPRARGPRARRRPPITLATSGPGDIFGELAMFDDERRSATVEAIDALDALGDPGRRHAPADPRHPEIAVKLVDLARPPPAGRQRAAGAPVLPDRAEPRRRRARPARRPGARGGRRRARRADHRHAGRVAQLAGSSRESASRFLAVLERAGVITQGRGRLTVHDPEALERLCLLTARPRRTSLLRRRRVRGRERARDHARAGTAACSALPKGAPTAGETPRAGRARARCARRPASTRDVVEQLGDVRYSYRRGGRRIAQDRPLLPLRVRRRRARRPRPRGRGGPLDAARARPARRLSYPGERGWSSGRCRDRRRGRGSLPRRCRS